MRLQDYRGFAHRRPLFVGITCMSGPQIRYGLEFARRVRAESRAARSSGAACTRRCCPSRRRPATRRRGGPGRERAGRRPPGRRAGRRRAARRRERPHLQGDGAIASTPDAELIDLDTHPGGAALRAARPRQVPHAAGRAGPHADQPRLPSPLRLLLQHRLQQARAGAARARARVVDEMQHLLRAVPAREDHRPSRRQLLRRPQARRGRSARQLLRRGIKVAWRANCRFDYLATLRRGVRRA